MLPDFCSIAVNLVVCSIEHYDGVWRSCENLARSDKVCMQSPALYPWTYTPPFFEWLLASSYKKELHSMFTSLRNRPDFCLSSKVMEGIGNV